MDQRIEKEIFNIVDNLKFKKDNQIKVTDVTIGGSIAYHITHNNGFSFSIIKHKILYIPVLYIYNIDALSDYNLGPNEALKLIKKETIQEDRINKINQIM